MRIRGLLNRLIPLGYEVLPSADESSKDEQIQVPISHLSSLFSSLQPSISSDVDLAFYDSELLTREVISQVHLQRSKFGINSSTPTEVGVESLGFVDLPSLIDFVLRLQHESLRLLSALSQSSNEIIEEESLALRQLYEARGDVDDDDKGKLKARAETPLLPSHLIELFDPIGIQDYASQHGLCYPSEVFQITGSDGTEKRILALHSLLRILAFCPHLEALWILSEPETPNQNSVTTVTIAKKAAKIWETLRSKSLLLPKVKDEPQKGAESNSSKNSLADCKPLERLTLSSVSSTSSEILALIDSYFESDGVENVDSEASNISDTRTTATLAVVVIDSVDSFFKKEELNGKASIVELGVGLVARARKSGMRVYVLNSESPSTSNPLSTFDRHTSVPSLGNVFSHTIDGTLSLSLGSDLLVHQENEGRDDEPARTSKSKGVNETQGQTQTQTQSRRTKPFRTIIVEKLEDGKDSRGMWSAYRSDGIDILATRGID